MIITVIITINKSNLIRYYEHDVELVMENTKWQVQVKPKKTKCWNHENSATVMNHYPKNG